MRKDKIIHAGHYYGERHDGERIDLGRTLGVPPDVVICRRVADYPLGPPAAAGIMPCSQCTAPIAYNPAGPHQQAPKICMQCARIHPLPIEAP